MSGSLELQAVEIRAGERRLLGPLDLRIPPGRVTALMGASGSGKSSLLAYVCGTLAPGLSASGHVRLQGRDLSGLAPEARRVGILFQDDLLFPHLTVGENLSFALPRGLPRPERRRRVLAALEEAELPGFQNRAPSSLSGGQRARIALMRTLISEPEALLLDEPFGKLDRALRQRIRRFVLDHARASQLPTLLVTHDPEDAEQADSPILSLDEGVK